jgi:hypothetical protein
MVHRRAAGSFSPRQPQRVRSAACESSHSVATLALGWPSGQAFSIIFPSNPIRSCVRSPGPAGHTVAIGRRVELRPGAVLSHALHTSIRKPLPGRRCPQSRHRFTGMRALRQLEAWQWIRRSLHTLRQTWHETDDCSAPDCEERAMHFPPSRFCRTHLNQLSS